jgi:uncharacterized protein (TIGR04222 family)
MIDILTQMSLVQFGLFSIGCIVLIHLWVNSDGSNHHQMPPITQFNAFELAALNFSYKDRNIIEIALVNLWHRQLIEITGEEKDTRIKQLKVAHQRFDNDIEKIVYQFASTERKPDDFFDTDLRSQLEPYIKPIHQKLENAHLKRTPVKRKQGWFILGLVCLLISSAGWLNRFLLGGQFEVKDIIVLISFIFFTSLFLMILLSIYFGCTIINTKLGCRYRKKLTQHFKWLKSKKNSARIDPALVIALFNMTVLTRFEAFAPFAKAFSKSSESSGSSSDGGCGGS